MFSLVSKFVKKKIIFPLPFKAKELFMRITALMMVR